MKGVALPSAEAQVLIGRLEAFQKQIDCITALFSTPGGVPLPDRQYAQALIAQLKQDLKDEAKRVRSTARDATPLEQSYYGTKVHEASLRVGAIRGLSDARDGLGWGRVTLQSAIGQLAVQ
jgi:hypothetical protein